MKSALELFFDLSTEKIRHKKAGDFL